MSKFTKLGASLATIFLAGTLIALSAAPSKHAMKTPTGKRSASGLANSVIFNRQLLSTTQSYGETEVSDPGGFVALDSPLKFTCPAGTTCTVSTEQHVQMSNNQTSGNDFAICTKLDGAFMKQPDCPTLGEIPVDAFITGSFTQSASNVNPGSHTLQTFVFTSSPATADIYNITYRLYKP